MSSTRYIEIDSTYRNRLLWPEPAEFEIPISQSGRSPTALNAQNPISFMSPSKVWSSNNFDVSVVAPAFGTTISGTLDLTSLQGIQSTSTQFVMIIATGKMQQEANYYRFATITIANATQDRRIIASSLYLGVETGGVNEQMLVTLISNFVTIAHGQVLTISDPTVLNLGLRNPHIGVLVPFANPQIFVPNGHFNENAYFGNILYNETRQQSRKIFSYSAITHMLTLVTSDSSVSTTRSGPVTLWQIGDSYSIRRENPLYFENHGANTLSRIKLTAATNPNTQEDFYKNQFIRVQAGPGSSSVAYNTTLYPNLTYGPPPVNEIRRIIKSEESPPGSGIVYLHVDVPFSVPPNNLASWFEVLWFSEDSFNPFFYNGSITSQQDMVCYELELINLVLPNRTLEVCGGGYIPFYPYVYVEISNVSSAIGSSINPIYSNNPNSTSMIFRAAVDDVNDPITSAFVKIDGDGMTQTLKFKPNDNLKFSVRMARGELYKTDKEDRLLPGEADPEIQISACF